ncbi:hypothetical protein F5144DRAFT_492211 [Chaetomium tenue]|uniref:Uncharacterized protein n=1 Tax=Chaetomium tenue TaxID=1854479 RepID=A0ACB7P2G1_9PEZI|nr:hypothetical protein F5144DRAFT_492211 [Chaetomium globosum]
MDQTSEELQKRLSEAIFERGEKQKELDSVLEFLQAIDDANLDQMSGSASSARSRIKKQKAKTVKEEKEEYERRRDEIEVSMAQMMRKIVELQEALGTQNVDSVAEGNN